MRPSAVVDVISSFGDGGDCGARDGHWLVFVEASFSEASSTAGGADQPAYRSNAPAANA